MLQPLGPGTVLESAHAVAAETARAIRVAAAQAIAERGRFQLVLAGGRTPLAAYTLIAGERADWDRWHIFLGDERCLAIDDEGRNSLAISRALVSKVPIPAESQHWIAAELGAERAAALYEAAIAPHLPFDLVLLGMGEDGHTASLFPGQAILPERLVLPIYNAPKPPLERVTLTPAALSSCRSMLIVVTGAEKGPALGAWQSGADLPVARVAALGSARILVDRDAADVALGALARTISNRQLYSNGVQS